MRKLLVAACSVALVGCSDRPPAKCENLVSEVLRLSETNRMQSYGIAIVNVTNISELARDKTGTSCLGLATMSNTEQARIKFWTYIEGNRWMIQYQPI